MHTPSDPDRSGLSAGEEQPGGELLDESSGVATAHETGPADAAPADVSVSASTGVGGAAVEHEPNLEVPPLARHMTFIDLLTYVVSSRRICKNVALLLVASAVVVAILVISLTLGLSHVHAGFTADLTSAKVTVALTSAGTTAVAAVAGSRTIKRHRTRRAMKRTDNPAKGSSEPKQ